MTEKILDSIVNNNTCEAAGCFAKATTKIDVKVGNQGTISLDLCGNCVNKFDQKERVLEAVGEPGVSSRHTIESPSKECFQLR
jgi:hypothetical protein